jgi:hypothetical protein
VIVLFAGVMGGLDGGVFTATEPAGIGAFVIALARRRMKPEASKADGRNVGLARPVDCGDYPACAITTTPSCEADQ